MICHSYEGISYFITLKTNAFVNCDRMDGASFRCIRYLNQDDYPRIKLIRYLSHCQGNFQRALSEDKVAIILLVLLLKGIVYRRASRREINLAFI